VIVIPEEALRIQYMTGKTIGWHSDDVAEPSQLSLHDDVLHRVDVGSAATSGVRGTSRAVQTAARTDVLIQRFVKYGSKHGYVSPRKKTL